MWQIQIMGRVSGDHSPCILGEGDTFTFSRSEVGHGALGRATGTCRGPGWRIMASPTCRRVSLRACLSPQTPSHHTLEQTPPGTTLCKA